MVGQGSLLFVRADQQAHDTGADIAQIVARAATSGHPGRPVRSPSLPQLRAKRRRRSPAVVDPEAGGFDQIGVFQKLPVRQENAGLRFPGALTDGAVKFFQFGARPVDRVVEVGGFRPRIHGKLLDDGLRVFAKLINGRDGDAGCCGDATDQSRLILYLRGCRIRVGSGVEGHGWGASLLPLPILRQRHSGEFRWPWPHPGHRW